jgi:ketosteroid isomerase-like protein
VGALKELLEPLYATRSIGAGVPLMLAVTDPDILFHPAALWPDAGGTYRGHAELAAYFEKLEDAFRQVHYVTERWEERGDHVAVAVRLETRGRHTGLEGHQRLSHLWRFRHGRAVELWGYLDAEEAFAALPRPQQPRP